ncbi:MAG: lytic transglycosylase domain-containing protein [Deltaproteobacteria bacterium]|nr:lytic transglycosylase domain-containing protein [Deltaproteobacteria bacterium]
MEEISISWPLSGHATHHYPYFRVIYLLLLFSFGFLIHVQSAPGAEPEKGSPPIALNAPQNKILSSARITIKPVEKNKSDRFNPMIKKAAERYHVEPALIKAVIMTESAYNPRAVSRQGAKGLMQLMPETAHALGVKNAFNPAHNINGGVKYLRQLLDAFNHNIKLALAAYNAGVAKVKQHGGIPPIKATRHYVKTVVAYYHHYKSLMVDKTENV